MTPETLFADCRQQFPALQRQLNGRPVAYFDGPAGTQVPQRVIDAIVDYLSRCNANHGGLFLTSRESDALLDAAHAALADFVGAADPNEIAFGPNMTTLTFALSRALARTWRPGDEVIVTRLDHDANFSPWQLAARDAGATLRVVDIHPADGTLQLDQLRGYLNQRTRLVAVGCASNSVGTLNPVQQITEWAHAVGAQVFLDAVHYAPHGLIDVQAWGCDYLACSTYKFFGPHVGVLWGRRELLEQLPAYKVRPAPNSLPGKWMTGTQAHELLVGAAAAVDYLADLGLKLNPSAGSTRRAALAAAYVGINEYERAMALRLLNGLRALPDIKVWGINDPARIAERCATFSITHRQWPPAEIATRLGNEGLFAWQGNYYALNLSEAWGREPEGMVRIGLVHYNTAEEVDRLLEALARIGAP